MPNKEIAANLPLFDSSEPITAALEDANAGALRAVVSTDGTNFWLHEMSDLTAARRGRPVKFEELRHRQLPLLKADDARAAGLDMFAPDADKVRFALNALGSDVVIAAIARGTEGERVALVFSMSSFPVALTRYVCSSFGESYPESVYRAHGGNCPSHVGATLSRQP
jgi:hypothetical protein